MTLVDSSCWVEYYRPGGAPAIQKAVAGALESGEAAICGIIRVEVLAFIARKAEFEIVAEDFGALHDLEIRKEDFERAVVLGRALRAHGSAAPATDLVVAAVAIGHGAELLHSDRHFITIARHSILRQKHVG